MNNHPVVAIVMGSQSDLETFQETAGAKNPNEPEKPILLAFTGALNYDLPR